MAEKPHQIVVLPVQAPKNLKWSSDAENHCFPFEYFLDLIAELQDVFPANLTHEIARLPLIFVVRKQQNI